MAILEIKNDLSEYHGAVNDIEPDDAIQVADQFKYDARQITDENERDEYDAFAFYCFGAYRFCDGKRPTAPKAEQHHTFKYMGSEFIHVASLPLCHAKA
jgi:hypothetical protein